MIPERLIEVDIGGYWHAGTGRGGGEDADALVERDGDDLPYLPGRHLRGLLRDACLRLERWGGLQEHTTRRLFGIDPFEANELRDDRPAGQVEPSHGRHETVPGCLAVGNAVLPQPLRDRLRDPPARRSARGKALEATPQSRLRRGLTVFVTQTEIAETGVASTGSLRRIEVAIPLRLYATMRWVPEARLLTPEPGDEDWIEGEASRWPEAVRDLLPLVRAVGAHRSRGYGRARLDLVEAVP